MVLSTTDNGLPCYVAVPAAGEGSSEWNFVLDAAIYNILQLQISLPRNPLWPKMEAGRAVRALAVARAMPREVLWRGAEWQLGHS